VSAMNLSIYSREKLEKLPENELFDRLLELQNELRFFLENENVLQEFFTKTYDAIEQLKAVGHDLWSIDYDSETEQWGGNYMEAESAGKLSTKFNLKDRVIVSWKQ